MSNAINSELVKLKHSLFWIVHIGILLCGAGIFTLYLSIYKGISYEIKVEIILEVIEVIVPIFISIVTSINILQEEGAGNFQSILTVPKRVNTFMAKFIIHFVVGFISLIAMCALILILVSVLKLNLVIMNFGIVLMKGILVIAFGSLIIYLWHFFLGMQFGLGVSIFFGIFECLQIIFYSNITLMGIWKYIPFAWSVELAHYVVKGNLIAHGKEVIIMIIIDIVIFILVGIWISMWEGRGN